MPTTSISQSLRAAADALEHEVNANRLVVGKPHQIKKQSPLHKVAANHLEGSYDAEIGHRNTVLSQMASMEDAASTLSSIVRTVEKLAGRLDDPRDARFDALATDLLGQVNIVLANLGQARKLYEINNLE